MAEIQTHLANDVFHVNEVGVAAPDGTVLDGLNHEDALFLADFVQTLPVGRHGVGEGVRLEDLPTLGLNRSVVTEGQGCKKKTKSVRSTSSR